MTPQEEAIELQRRVNEELMAYQDAQRAANKETQKRAETEAKIEGVTSSVIQIFEKLYNAQLKYTIAMAEGKKGAGQFNDSIDAMTEATQMAAVALSLLVPGGALVKGVVAGLTFLATQSMKTAAEMQKAANLQADATYKAFSAFSKAGATASDGLSGFFKDVNRMRLNVRELDQLAGVLANSAQEMATMGGTVFKARTQFADLNEGLRKYERGFLRLGLSNEETAEASLGFMKLQNTLSQGQQRDYGKLSGAAKKYIEEQEILTRVTGFNRKQQEAAQEKYLSQQRFGAKIAALEAEGTEESRAAAKRLVADMQKAAAVSDDFGQAFADSVTGMLTTDAAVRGNQSTNGKLLEYQNDVLEGRIKTDQEANAAFQGVISTMAEVGKASNMAGQTGVFEDYLLSFKTFQKATQLANNNFAEQMDVAKGEVDKLAGTIGGVDKQLDRYTGMLERQITQMAALQQQLNGQFSEGQSGSAIMEYLQKLVDSMKPTIDLFMKLWEIVLPGLAGTVDIVVKALNVVALLLQGDFVGAVNETIDGIWNFATGWGESVERFIQGLFDIIDGFAKQLERGVKSLFEPLMPIFDNFGNIMSGLGDSVKNGLTEFTDALVNMVSDLWNKLTSLIPGLDTVQNAASSVSKFASGAASSAGDFFGSMFGGGGSVQQTSGGGGGGVQQTSGGGGGGGGGGGMQKTGGAGAGRGSGGAAFPPAAGGGPGQSTSNVTTFSDRLINYIRATERFTPRAFWDKKQYTNGYGTEASSPEEVVTKAEAETRLQKYLNNAVAKVISYGKDKGYNWSQGQVDALTSFAYNGGIGMLDQLTQGGKRSNEEIAKAMTLYNKATDRKTGKTETLPGLTARRAEELAMFQAANGGIFDGPKSGYAATLHGHEAVIPLKNGAVPVAMSQEFNMTATNLGELVAIMKDNVGMQDRMLAVLDEMRRSQNATANHTGKMVAMAA